MNCDRFATKSERTSLKGGKIIATFCYNYKYIQSTIGRSYPSFIDAYHILSRNMERSGQSVYMMLLTLVDYEGKKIANQNKLEIRGKLLQEAISITLRQGDTYCKYSSSQFLLLLVGTSKESCKIVYRRILNKYKMLAGPRAEIEYSVVSLADLPEKLAVGE